MQKFRRHPYFWFAHVFVAFSIGAIVHGLVSAEVSLWMKDRSFLYVPLVELTVKFCVPSFLVSVAPPYNRRMIDIACHHFADKLLTVYSLVVSVPSAQFIHYIKSKTVADIIELRVSRVV